ncbi:MAG: cadherin-like domain-containing protein [Chloroflexi bacterium]|nr:cadherin-like domain-containing protein [Chloroflexota bacterium]
MAHPVIHNSAKRLNASGLLAFFTCFMLIASLWATPVYAGVNVEPTLDPIGDQTVLEDSAPTTVQLTGIGPGVGDEGLGQNLTVTASSSDPLILPDPAVTYTNPENAGSLSLAPAQNMFGEVDVTVTVQDDGGTDGGGDDSISRTFHVAVTPVNDAPTISAFTRSGTRGKSLAFTAQDFLNVYSDVEINPLSGIKIVSLPTIGRLVLDGVTLSINAEVPAGQLGKLAFVPSISWYGSTSFSWSASDGQDYSSPAAVYITYPYSPLYSYIPFVLAPLPPPPAAFNKTNPANGATGLPVNPILDWEDSAGATEYQFCCDANINNTCDGSWASTGTISRAQLDGLTYSTKYEWQVQAINPGGTTYSNGSDPIYFTFTTVAAPPWVKAFGETFEGAFPGKWVLSSYSYLVDGWYEVTDQVSWGKRNCHAASGSYGGWAVGGGSVGSTVPCNGSYPWDTQTLMVYGPIDLSQVKDGQMTLKIWLDTELNYDIVGFGVSRDNEWFYGDSYSGNSNGWITDTIDLKNVYYLGNVTGAPQVWIGIWFESDSDNMYIEEGVAVDDLVLSTCASSSGCAGTPSASVMNEFPDTLQVRPASKSLHPIAAKPASGLLGNILQEPWLSRIFEAIKP